MRKGFLIYEEMLLLRIGQVVLVLYTGKKENRISFICKEVLTGSVAKSYMSD